AWLTNIRQDSRYTDVLEAGSRKKPIPAINRLQPSFWRLLSQPGLTPPSIPQGAEYRAFFFANEAFLGGGHATNEYVAGGENARCVACFYRIRNVTTSAAVQDRKGIRELLASSRTLRRQAQR